MQSHFLLCKIDNHTTQLLHLVENCGSKRFSNFFRVLQLANSKWDLNTSQPSLKNYDQLLIYSKIFKLLATKCSIST